MSERPADHELVLLEERIPPPSGINDLLVVALSALAAVAGLVFAIGLLAGAPFALYGSALALALGAFAYAVRRYFTDRYPDVVAAEPRGEAAEPAGAPPRAAIAEITSIPRRPLLRRALAAAGGLLGLSLIAPVASLGPRPGTGLTRTAWQAGARLVTGDGLAVRPEQLPAGGVASVWPAGAIGQERAAALVLRLSVDAPRPPTVPAWVVDGNVVAYSKICTHAGCPVALYRERDNALFCPCHQSTFDVSRGAVPTFGPAARPLPQLPLGVDAEGFLIALGDFEAPVGPPF